MIYESADKTFLIKYTGEQPTVERFAGRCIVTMPKDTVLDYFRVIIDAANGDQGKGNEYQFLFKNIDYNLLTAPFPNLVPLAKMLVYYTANMIGATTSDAFELNCGTDSIDYCFPYALMSAFDKRLIEFDFEKLR